MKFIVKIEEEAKRIFFRGQFALNLTLVLAILMERLNPEFGDDWQTENEDIDHYLTLISSKIVKISHNLSTGTAKKCLIFYWDSDWDICDRSCETGCFPWKATFRGGG